MSDYSNLSPRFKLNEELVLDKHTGLCWTRDAALSVFPCSWEKAIRMVRDFNRTSLYGHSDWRLPNRREMRSILHLQAKNPVLPEGHPFINVFHGWYWTSTTAAINTGYAWWVHMGGARMFYGRKDEAAFFWPVRGKSNVTPATGQTKCFDGVGREIPCSGTGQDGEFHAGRPWPYPRYKTGKGWVVDLLTGLTWTQDANLSITTVKWQEAFSIIKELNEKAYCGFSNWRLPSIDELESLVDSSQHTPALSTEHPFKDVKEFYWSSTNSFYDPLWSWALYLYKGAIGVGLKEMPNFYVWAVRGEAK